ncbi:MAG: hypothetical protein E7290_10220 [Lachnospiraceae bacterium]|nr:hypothetical protein [Lachnospiraceae bacterium]
MSNIQRQIKELQNSEDIVFMAKGKEFSEASADILALLDGWLKMSGLKEQELLAAVKAPDFRLEYKRTEDEVCAGFYVGQRILGMPFICQGAEAVEAFNMDLALLLLCVASKSNDRNVYKVFVKYIKKFALV